MSVANTIRPPSAFPDAGLVRLSQILAPARPPWRDQTRVAAVAAGPADEIFPYGPAGARTAVRRGSRSPVGDAPIAAAAPRNQCPLVWIKRRFDTSELDVRFRLIHVRYWR
jgi:hypothetical protein